MIRYPRFVHKNYFRDDRAYDTYATFGGKTLMIHMQHKQHFRMCYVRITCCNDSLYLRQQCAKIVTTQKVCC